MTTCPRCDSTQSKVLTESPVKGAWVIYSCPVCFFTWRSTEPDMITDPAKYPKPFKVDPADIPNATQVPAIPARLSNVPTFPPSSVKQK
jgi:vanillate/4-hydroxybenzoate decarboxylase subunit D